MNKENNKEKNKKFNKELNHQIHKEKNETISQPKMLHTVKMQEGMSKYLLFWFSQAVSSLGSSMTGFALILWAHGMTGSALTVSLMTFCNYVPYILASLFAGGVVDRHSKKRIMLLADLVAVLCSVMVLVLRAFDSLQIIHIYMVNCVLGLTNAFQQPASAVAVGQMVSKEKLGQVSGLNSFSGNLVAIVAPVFASALYALGGLGLILAVDFGTFLFAFFILLIFIKVPEVKTLETKFSESQMQTSKSKVQLRKGGGIFAGCREGFAYLFENKGLWYIVTTMSLLNFLSRLTYENILSPMILDRSGNSSMALGCVNAAVGIGGVAGGVLVSLKKLPKDKIKTMYVSAALSFAMGDLMMGLGRNTFFWCVAGFAASAPIPFILAAENVILYENIPKSIQGRVFAARNAIQFGTIPLGILLGGFLAEYVFEPLMVSDSVPARLLEKLVGTGAGSGMAVMFLCTGVAGSLFSVLTGRRRELDGYRKITE